MSNQPHKIGLLPDHKWVRFFRMQYAVKQTAANRRRLAQGQKQMGRPTPRLVSIDFEDAYMVPEVWTPYDVCDFARQSVIPYFAYFMDGEYRPLPSDEVHTNIIQSCLDTGKIFVLPMEGVTKW